MEDVKLLVRERYGTIARKSLSGGCCPGSSCGSPEASSSSSRALGYSETELGSLPEGANLGLGCGNPQGSRLSSLARRFSTWGVAAARRSEALAEQVEEPSDSTDPASELAGCLTPFLERLPAHYREALELTEIQGWTQQRAADHLGLSLSGVKSRVSRRREKLKALLLDCCHVELDRRKGIADYTRKSDGACSCGRPSGLVKLERGTTC